jgi:hypothetical protein
MKREEAVTLLKELLLICPTFVTAAAVSLFEEKDAWGLSVMWTPDVRDGNCLEKIVAKYNLDIVTSGERTTFRSHQKQS